jgi:hypothetical protein
MPFEMEETDAAVADAMTIRLVFSGNGTQPVTDQEEQEMLRFANDSSIKSL